MKPSVIKITVIAVRVALGLLFIYAGIQKFVPKTQEKQQAKTEISQSEEKAELPENTQKIKALIGGMKKSGYFWEFVGISEILCGILLVSQYYALLGAVMMVPLTLNIFLFHLFLEPDETGELVMTLLYLLANLALLGYNFPKLKHAFLNLKN